MSRISEENPEHAAQYAVQPIREDPKEQDNENDSYRGANFGETLRRLLVGYHFVESKQNGTTVKRINRQKVQYGQ